MTQPVFLVRHGEVHNPEHIVYADLAGFGLSELGRWQAEQAARHLAGRSVAAVVASPLERAQETARPIATPHALAVQTDPELSEWRLMGRWRGRRWEELDDHFPGELAAYLAHPWDMAGGGESLAELAERMATAVERLAAAAAGPLVVVSHQDPIQAARLTLTGRPLQELHNDKPNHAEVIELRPGSEWEEVSRWAPAQTQTG